MNMFVVDECPERSAVALCDKHIPKMAVESVQMLVSALRRHGATDSMVPITKAGTPHKGGYSHHPCTIWAGDSSANFAWLMDHAFFICMEFEKRFSKRHACRDQLKKIAYTSFEADLDIPRKKMTPIALAVGPKLQEQVGATHLPINEAVGVYRKFYISDKARFAKWEKGTPPPEWWELFERGEL